MWKKDIPKRLRSVIVVAAVILIIVLWFGSSVMEILRLIQQKNDLKREIAKREEVSSQLDEDLKQIGGRAYIETIARQYLGLYYPNEQIVIPVEAQKGTGSAESGAETDGEDTAAPADQESAAEAEPQTDSTAQESADEDEMAQTADAAGQDSAQQDTAQTDGAQE